jgi:Uma2 family endonuclease
MATTRQLMTAEELLRLPRDGQRHRLIAGELLTMTPAGDDHGILAMRLSVPLGSYVYTHHLGEVYAAETGFQLAYNPDTVQAADLAFVRRGRVRPFGQKTPAYFDGAPDLTVGVVSPNDSYTEVADTVQTWLSHGTEAVLVIDPRRRTATLHRPAEEPARTIVQTLSETDTLTIEEVFPGWSLPVAALFAEEPAS